MTKLLVAHLSKSFPTPSGPLEVLRDVSLEMEAGASVAVTGPSGCGKSTLLQIVGTLDEPTGGTVQLDDTDPFTLPDEALAAFRNRNIGFIFQDHYLLPQLTVWQNTLVPALATQNLVSAPLQTRAADLLARVGLGDRLGHRPGELSGGQRQRVAIARALLLGPALVLADEPTGNLDEATGERVCDLLLSLVGEEALMLITVTHSPVLAARMQRRFRLADGQLSDDLGR